MKKRLQKITVYSAFRRNNRGFSLVSTLLALSVSFMLLSLVPIVLTSLNQPTYYHELSIRQLFHFINNEFLIAVSVTSTDSIISLTQSNGEIVTIEHFGQVIRRQVMGKGHEILVRDVEKMKITDLPFGIRIMITTIKGESYEKTISF